MFSSSASCDAFSCEGMMFVGPSRLRPSPCDGVAAARLLGVRGATAESAVPTLALCDKRGDVEGEAFLSAFRRRDGERDLVAGDDSAVGDLLGAVALIEPFPSRLSEGSPLLAPTRLGCGDAASASRRAGSLAAALPLLLLLLLESQR